MPAKSIDVEETGNVAENKGTQLATSDFANSLIRSVVKSSGGVMVGALGFEGSLIVHSDLGTVDVSEESDEKP